MICTLKLTPGKHGEMLLIHTNSEHTDDTRDGASGRVKDSDREHLFQSQSREHTSDPRTAPDLAAAATRLPLDALPFPGACTTTNTNTISNNNTNNTNSASTSTSKWHT